MPDEVILSKGDSWYDVRIQSIVQTLKIFTDNLIENPNSTVDMETYCRDVNLLLTLLNKAGEELSNRRRIIT